MINDAGRQSWEAMETALKLGRGAAGKEHALLDQPSEFAAQLEVHSTNLAEFEAQYKNHIDNNFIVTQKNVNVVEKECGDLR